MENITYLDAGFECDDENGNKILYTYFKYIIGERNFEFLVVFWDKYISVNVSELDENGSYQSRESKINII